MPVLCLNAAYLGGAVPCRICRFTDAQFLDMLVVQDFLIPFLIGLLSPVFTQCMRPFNSLLLSLAAAQPVLMRHRGHQVDKYVIDVGYHGAGYWVSLRRLLI
ncbi:hypothetical protein AZ037_002316 [Klebsiella michiganensis]|nr:hypothetical protein AZ037_002316 [Klebsiella michiganensis]